MSVLLSTTLYILIRERKYVSTCGTSGPFILHWNNNGNNNNGELIGCFWTQRTLQIKTTRPFVLRWNKNDNAFIGCF